VAWADGELRGARREYAEAHVQTCAACRQWLARFDETAQTLQRPAPSGAILAGRVALKERLHREAVSPRRRFPSRSRFLALPPVAVGLALILAVLAWPLASVADDLFGDAIRIAKITFHEPYAEATPITGVAPSLPGVADVPFAAAEPEALPLGLTRTERSISAPDQLEQSFADGAGLEILVVQLPAREGVVKVESGTPHEVAVLRGTEVLWLPDPWPDSVGSLYWERGGVVFEVLALATPGGVDGGLKIGDALAVVEAIMAAQDAAS
jgi:anti-sigma factor RsiW